MRGQGLNQRLPEMEGFLLTAGRYRSGDNGHPHVVLVPTDLLKSEEVDNALKIVLAADGNRQEQGLRFEFLLQLVHDGEKIGAYPVHLIDKDDARHLVMVGLVPDGFGLRFHAAHGAEHGHRAVQDAQ